MSILLGVTVTTANKLRSPESDMLFRPSHETVEFRLRAIHFDCSVEFAEHLMPVGLDNKQIQLVGFLEKRLKCNVNFIRVLRF